MNCQFAIVHELVKEKNSDRADIHYRETLLDLTDDKVITTVTSALSAIGNEDNRIMRGIFSNNGRQGTFPENSIRFFGNIQKNHVNIGEMFIGLTKVALNEIKSEIIKPASNKMSTGGYLLFSLHEVHNNLFFSCMMIKKNNGVAIDENLNITSSMYIDLKKLIQSFTLNLTRHAQILSMSTEEHNQANSEDSDNDLTYLKFIGHNKNKDPGADYFINAFGCERGSKSNVVTNGIIRAVNEFCKNPVLKDFKLKIKDSVTGYLSTIAHNKYGSLEGIKNVLNAQIQSIPNLPDDFNPNASVDEFINMLHKDKEDGGYGIPSEFPVNQTIVRRNSRVKISDENEDWVINLRAGLIGKSINSKVYFNEQARSLTINELNNKAIEELKKIFN